MSFWVYILKCADQSYYTGHTDNLERRLQQHQQRHYESCYTASRLPVQLCFACEFATRIEALAAEQQIKGWSRGKKAALIHSDWPALQKLSINHQN